MLRQIFEEAEQLPEKERLELANQILALSDSHFKKETEKYWDIVIRERIERYNAGNYTVKNAEEVFAELDRKLDT